MYVATMAFVLGPIRTSTVIRNSHDHSHHLRSPPTAQQTQQYNAHKSELQVHLPNLSPLCHVTTAWIIHTASYKLCLCY